MKDSIGGYFGLELSDGKEYWQNFIRLNTARNCLRYIIKKHKIKKIFVPGYTCPVVWDAVQAENCEVDYYSIDMNFMPMQKFNHESYVLYTNYFGICSENVRRLSDEYPLLIVDNSQSFYSGKSGLACFNSARKFFGVPDGAYLFDEDDQFDNLEADTSYEHCLHLLIRQDIGAQAGYPAFCNDEEMLNTAEVKGMSQLTQKILKGVDYENAAKIRKENFKFLHNSLCSQNQLKFDIGSNDVPMAYPFVCGNAGLRNMLIDNKIFVAAYWKGQKDMQTGKYFEDNLIPLPIDQRYDTDDMKFIVDLILKYLRG